MYRQKSKGWYKHKDFIFMDLCCIVIAFILAYIFNPIVVFLEKRLRFKRIQSLLFTYGILIILLVSSIVFTAPVIINSIIDIVNQIPIYIDKTQVFLIDLGKCRS